MISKFRLGDYLVERGVIREDYLKFALMEQKATGEKLGEVLLRLGLITDIDLAKALADQAGISFIDLYDVSFDPEAIKELPFNFISSNFVFPFDLQNGALKVALVDPFNLQLMNAVQRISRKEVSFYVASQGAIAKAIEKFYYLREFSPEEELQVLIDRFRINPDLEFDAEELFNKLLIIGILKRATDLLVVPTYRNLQTFYRVDGVLEPFLSFPSTVYRRLINIIKIRSQMDIAETRKPQDGRMSYTFLESKYDLRLATAPTPFGETITIRYLPTGTQVQNLDYLGFSTEAIKLIDEILSKPYGMFIVCGPTGSGKTTTLFAALRRINLLNKNVLTVEDPIEYLLPLVRQTQVNEEIGYTFAQAIRAFLRLAPDVILVGEIRDEETAAMALRAALTGHLVLSTLHTNDALSSIFRLKNMGVKGDLLGSTLRGVVAQRLVRKICPFCKENYSPPLSLLEYYNLPIELTYQRGKGCVHCNYRGYLGRTVISEIFYIDEEIAELIAGDEPSSTIFKAAQDRALKTLREDAREKVLQGITTVEEVKRVLG